MVTFTSEPYTGPFESRYEEHEALQGNRGNQAAHMAAQAQHSRGLRAKGLQDTSAFGTNKSIFGNNQYEKPEDNPLNFAMRFANRPQTNYTQSSGAQMAANQFRPEMLTQQGMQGSGGFLPFMSGGSGYMGASPKAKTGIGQFFTDISDAYRQGRQTLGMGIANLLSGGAFSDDLETKVQGLKDFGYSDAAARDYVQGTQNQLQRQKLSDALYGSGSEFGPGIDTSRVDTGSSSMRTDPPVVDPVGSVPRPRPIHIAPISVMNTPEKIVYGEPVPMAQGGLMSLRRR